MRLSAWTAAFGAAAVTAGAVAAGTASTGASAELVRSLRLALRHDLDTPEALQLIDDAVDVPLDDLGLVNRAISALLGVAL